MSPQDVLVRAREGGRLEDLAALLEEGFFPPGEGACIALMPCTRFAEVEPFLRELTLGQPVEEALRCASVLVLGEQGLAGLRALLRGGLLAGAHGRAGHPPVPRFDPEGRTLYWGESVVKALRRTAPAQEAVLAAFEEVGWSGRVADPLQKEQGLDPKERLRETVKSLNRGLRPGTLRFHADGTGCGVYWERLG